MERGGCGYGTGMKRILKNDLEIYASQIPPQK